MSTIYRPEKQTDPDKMPGQIINRPAQAYECRTCHDFGYVFDGYGSIPCWNCEKGGEWDDA